MNDEERFERGKQVAREFYGGELQMPFPADLEGDPFSVQTLKYLFGDTLARSRMSRREQRLVIMGALAGLGVDPSLFSVHVRSALATGDLTAEDLNELFCLVVHYVGQPRTTALKFLVDEILAELPKGALADA